MPARGHLGAYRDLLNEVISDAASGESYQFSTSRVGASVWHASEKNALNQQLRLVGAGGSRALSKATGKSESEVQSYLHLLRNRCENFSLADAPAAHELAKIEPDLDKAADALARRVFEYEVQGAKDQYGTDQPWLIDQEVAQAIEEYRTSQEETVAEHDDQSEGEYDHSPACQDGQYEQITTLLRPESFLHLSRNLFMNSSVDPDMNWNTCSLVSNEVEEPSIFRSAFEDFYNLAVSRTRRIVQASIFQAMSRLRASDSSRADWDPAAIVRDIDVHSALDMLNMESEKVEYWSKAARRCRVKVYSDSKKYADGRPGTKTGHELTWAEVEAELAAAVSSENDGIIPDDDISEADVEEFIANDGNFTEDDDDLTEESRLIKDETVHFKEEVSSSRSRSRSRSKKRKRAVSPHSFIRAENSYLEALDYNTSLTESNRISDLLELNSKRASKLRELRERALPDSPGLPPDGERTTDWRSRVEYEAEWEQLIGPVDDLDFREMEIQGVAGRKRRAALLERVKSRLGAGYGAQDLKKEPHGGMLSEGSEDDISSDSFDDSDEDGDVDDGDSSGSDAIAGAQQDSSDESM